MGNNIESKNKLTVIVGDKYLKSRIFDPIDELFVGAIKYLRDKCKSCEFLGFNIMNGHVVLIDYIKYCTLGEGVYDIETLSYEVFSIVEDGDQDYREKYLNYRVEKILDELGDKKI
jgi:hypothetical protein